MARGRYSDFKDVFFYKKTSEETIISLLESISFSGSGNAKAKIALEMLKTKRTKVMNYMVIRNEIFAKSLYGSAMTRALLKEDKQIE